MAGAASGPGWRGKAAGKASAGNPNWRQAAPGSAAGASSRAVKLLALAGCAAAVVVGVVIMIQLMAKPQRAGLIAVAGDPASADRLDVPYDPAGWLSAQRLLDAVKANPDDKAIGPVAGGDKPFAIHENHWLEALSLASNVDPVVVYVGLAGGVNRLGEAVLYTGYADQPPVRVVELVARLTAPDATRGKRVVLVLDAGRQAPDPNLGEVAADFGRAVREDKSLNEDIAKAKKLAVILATGDEARAWDSPDHGLTMLATALRSGLLGGAGRAEYTSFGVTDLATAVAAEVERTSTNQRPTAQRPVLLPAAAEWSDSARAREFADGLFYRPTLREFDPTPAPPLDAPPGLLEYWDDAAKLARPANRPPPWVYTPAAWRRYRELGLRYEQAFVAGDLDGQAVLKAACKDEASRIVAGTGVLLEKSRAHALPLAAALGLPAAANLGPTVRGAATLGDLAKALGDDPAFKAKPPTEAHLPLMLHDYATRVAPPAAGASLDGTWKPAALCRLLAEQAALSVAEDTKVFASSERIWPAVSAAVVLADVSRRRGEDRTLADDAAKPAPAEFAAATAGYQEALGRGVRLQKAFALRDEAFADLPFLTRWATEVEALADAAGDPAALAADANAAWKAAHLLAEVLDKALKDRTPKSLAALDAAADEARGRTQRLRAAAEAEARVIDRNKAQTSWQALQYLAALPVPLASPAEKAANFRAAREIASRLRAAEGQVAEKAASGTAKEVGKAVAVAESVRAERRTRAIAASLGSPHGDWDLDRSVKTLRETSEVTARGREERSREAAFVDPAKPDESEALSRLGVPHRATVGYEPAAANARTRWAALLDAQAHRTALDHWFGVDNQPYLTKFAQDYLDDAKPLRDAANPPPASPDATAAGKLIAAANAAAWGYESAPGDGLGDWTTEPDNRFAYRFQLANYEKLLDAEAVVWASLSSDETLTLAEPATRPRLVSWQADPAREVAVPAACGVALEKRKGTVSLTATAYFRGRRVATPQAIAFNGRPHVVQTDLPPPARAAVAVRADVDPGAVAIVIDYSGSMKDNWGESGRTKKQTVVSLMEELLPKIAPGTRLSIRLMRENKPGDESRLIFNSNGPLGVNALLVKDRLAILSTLKSTVPDGLTPLVRTIRLAADEDFPKDFEGVKTLIVVTDGADTSHIKDADVPQPAQPGYTVDDVFRYVANGVRNSDLLIRKVNEDIEREFRAIKPSIQMVVFGADQFELDLAQAMFRPLEDFAERNLGRIIVAKNETSLRQEILDSLRPRVKVFFGGQAVGAGKSPNDVPKIGIPADLVTGDDVIWRGSLEAQSYALKYLNTSAEVKLGSGDALSVRLRKAQGDFKYEFERECYYRDVRGKKPGVKGDRAAETPTHFAHVSNFGTRNPGSALTYLAAVASVDRTDSLRPGRDGVLAMQNPKALWWEVRRGPVGSGGAADGARYDKALSVWNAYGLAAPSWRLVADGVRESAELTRGLPFRLAVWPLDTPPLVDRFAFSNSDLEVGAERTVGEVRVRAKLEDLRFLGTSYPGPAEAGAFPAALTAKPQRCLVLRIDDKRGRLLRAKVSWENNAGIAARQHLYYFRDPKQVAEKAEVKAYTVIVGPVTDDFVATQRGAEVELLDLGESLRQVPSRRLDLDLGLPTDEDRGLDAVPFPLAPPQPAP